MKTIPIRLRSLARTTRDAGPYLFLEILLPGGTLFALMLLLYRRRARGRSLSARQQADLLQRWLANVRAAVASVQPQGIATVACPPLADDSDGLGPLAMLPSK